MRFSPQRDYALGAAARRLRARDARVFPLFGFAGTSKTTLAKHLAEQLKTAEAPQNKRSHS